VFFFIGIIVFGAKFQEEFVTPQQYRFSYAYGLAIVGCIAQIVVGVLLFVNNRQTLPKEERIEPLE